MEIINLRPNGAGTNRLAEFDLRLTPDLMVHGLILKRNQSGQLRTIVPNLRGTHVVSIAPELAGRISRAAFAELQGRAEAHGAIAETAA